MGKLLTILMALAGGAGIFQSVGLCGVQRWSVKVFTDPDAPQVSLTPQTTTVASLRALEMPTSLYPNRGRMPPHELTTYSLVGRLIERKLEEDSDLHIVLAEPTKADATMIVEIPAAACAIGSPLMERLNEARKRALALPLGTLVEVVGIGFFDFIHAVNGQAPNGFELHPVFRVDAVPVRNANFDKVMSGYLSARWRLVGVTLWAAATLPSK